MRRELISVVVPVYNVEKYLERCINSLLVQSYENLEIILVDDGSPDNCPEICDNYANIYGNVKVVHKKNGGLSSARNAGVAVANGDFIGFVDSDDWVAPDMYEYLYQLMKKHKADAAEIKYAMVRGIDDSISAEKEQVHVYDGKDALQYYMISTTKTGSYSVCRCLFAKNVFEGEFFREGKINEDIDMKYKLLSKCSAFVVSNQYKYFYFQSTGSITTAGLKRKDYDLYEAAEKLCELAADESYGTIRKLAKVKKARTAFSLLSKIAYYGISDSTMNEKETVRQLTKEHRKNLFILLDSPIPVSRKILSVMFAVNFKMTEFAIKFARKIIE